MKTITLAGPHIVRDDSPYLNSSREIAGYKFIIDPSLIGPNGFPTGQMGRPFGTPDWLTAWGLLTIPPGSRNIRIVDCEFEGPWDDILAIPEGLPGHPSWLCGIDMYYANGIQIEGCNFERLPRFGISFTACSGVDIRDVWGRNCVNLIHADYVGTPRNRFISIKRVQSVDGWQALPMPKNAFWASGYDPRRGIGSNAVSGWFADSTISQITTSGEAKAALKLVNPIRVKVDRSEIISLMQQGTMYFDTIGDRGAYNSSKFDASLGAAARDVEFTRCTFRLDQSAWPNTRQRRCLQLSYPQTDVRFRDCRFYRDDRPNSPGLQIWEGAECDIRDSVFVGWESATDGWLYQLGDYGRPGSVKGKINADLATANRFQL